MPTIGKSWSKECLNQFMFSVPFRLEFWARTQNRRTDGLENKQTERHLKTRNPAATKIADRTGCQWPSRSSKVLYFHFIWKGICLFLLVINSNLSRVSHRFWDMASFPLNFLLFLYLIPNLKMLLLHYRSLKFCMPQFNIHG